MVCWGRDLRSCTDRERSVLTAPLMVTLWVVASKCGIGPWLRS
jgi:hypothetical protein